METLKKIFNSTINFFKKGWTLLLIPIGLFIVRLFTFSTKKEIKAQGKVIEKEIKEDKKEIKETTSSIEKHEEEITNTIEEVKEKINTSSISDPKLEEILPGIKK